MKALGSKTIERPSVIAAKDATETDVDGVEVGRFPLRLVHLRFGWPVPPRSARSQRIAAAAIGSPLPNICAHIIEAVYAAFGCADCDVALL